MASSDEEIKKTPETSGKLSSADITKLGLNSLFEQVAFSFERMRYAARVVTPFVT